MKTRNIILFCLFLAVGIEGYSQPDTTSFLYSNQLPESNLIRLLPPLQLLIDSALANAPEMQIADASIMRSEYSVQLARDDWAELISINGRYNYGQFISNDGIGLTLSEPLGGYQVFAGVRVPLSYFVGRSQRLGALEAELEIRTEIKKQTALDLQMEVIETYNQLLLLQKLINISAEARESSLIQYQMAEERFRDGDITLEDLATATDNRANFASEYERLKTEFGNVFVRLERLVGTPFVKFPK